MAKACARRDGLARAVSSVLADLTLLTKAQLEAFQRDDKIEYMRIDKEVETKLGEKERTIGALHEHEVGHFAQTPTGAVIGNVENGSVYS